MLILRMNDYTKYTRVCVYVYVRVCIQDKSLGAFGCIVGRLIRINAIQMIFRAGAADF